MDYYSLSNPHPQFFKGQDASIRILLDQSEITAWQAKRKSQLAENSQPLEWGEIGLVLDDPYILVLRDLVEFPNGMRSGYLRIYNRAYIEGGAAGVAMLPQ